MKTRMRSGILIVLLTGIVAAAGGAVARAGDCPPSQYGNLLISRESDRQGMPWVSFSHWSHRVRYTCRVCHFELEFAMKVNATEITEERNQAGEFCGACHDGTVAFGHTEANCSRCHNGDVSAGEEKFYRLAELPIARYGNRIDWTQALREGLISPKQSIFKDSFKPMPFKSTIKLEAKDANIAPAVFPHREHNRWLDCAECHPDTFSIKKAATADLSMNRIHKGSFCGTCHSKVAFPINDCTRCHQE